MYKGPAAAVAKKKAVAIPLIPEFCPISLIIVSLGTHTSNKPTRRKIGGTIVINSFKLDNVILKALRPIVLLKKYNPVRIDTIIIAFL